MLNKIWTVAWKDIYSLFSDRNAVLILILAPLVVATIIALALGGLSGGNAPVRDIPVAIVNQDQGANGQNLGAIFLRAFIPGGEGTAANTASCALASGSGSDASTNTSLQDLTDAVKLDDAAVAKAGVDEGKYTAAIIIPADFSQKAIYGQNKPIQATDIEVYANGGREIAATIVRGIVTGITDGITTGNVTVAATIDTLIGRAQDDPAFGVQFLQTSQNGSFQPDFACAFSSALNTISVQQETLPGQQTSGTAALLVLFGSAQAMFFCLFTGQGGVQDFFMERRQGTLQRMVVSPTPRIAILLGKLTGTLVTCVVQLVFLFIALTIVASLLTGSFVLIWGSNLLMVGLVIIGAGVSSTGLGVLIAGISKTPEQGQVLGSLVNITMSVMGGAFGFRLPEVVGQFSILYWGTDAFQKLSSGRNDIGLNLLVLVAFGAILFAIGFYFFNRRLEV